MNEPNGFTTKRILKVSWFLNSWSWLKSVYYLQF